MMGMGVTMKPWLVSNAKKSSGYCMNGMHTLYVQQLLPQFM